MITKEIRELHFDSTKETKLYIKMYEKMGWKILSTSSENDCFLKCEKTSY